MRNFKSFSFLFIILSFFLISCSTFQSTKNIEEMSIQLNTSNKDNYKEDIRKVLFGEEEFTLDWGYSMHTIQEKHLQMELLQRNFKADYLILQLHGGGFQSPITDIYRKSAQKYIKYLPVDVLTPDYRTSPTYQYPAALDDAFLAWQWAIKNGYEAKNIVFAGDSAGGNLALALALKLKNSQLPLPSGIVLMSPFTDLTLSFEAHKRNKDVDLFFNYKRGTNPFIKGNEGNSFITDYTGDEELTNPYISPYFGNYLGFPPMLIQVGTREVLEDDSLMLYKKVKEAHVDAKLTKYEKMYHVFQLSDLTQESRQAWQEVRIFIKKVLDIKDEGFEIGPPSHWRNEGTPM